MSEADLDLLFVHHDPQPADLAVAFGYHLAEGADQRARAAARLYLGGFVPRLLFSGGSPYGAGTTSEAARMAGVAAEMGVPPEAILVEPHSRNTFENAILARELLRQRGLLDQARTLLLVSCPWHMGRVLRIMAQSFPEGRRYLCCPHHESCTLAGWRDSPDCRRRVLAERDLLVNLIRIGVLPAEP